MEYESRLESCSRRHDFAVLSLHGAPYPSQSQQYPCRYDWRLYASPTVRPLALASLSICGRSPVFLAVAATGVLWPHEGTCARECWRHNPVQGEPLTVTERKIIPMNATDRILRLPTVLSRTGLSRSTLYRKIAEGTFPRQIQISIHGAGWYESEINRWIADPVHYGRHDTQRASL